MRRQSICPAQIGHHVQQFQELGCTYVAGYGPALRVARMIAAQGGPRLEPECVITARPPLWYLGPPRKDRQLIRVIDGGRSGSAPLRAAPALKALGDSFGTPLHDWGGAS